MAKIFKIILIVVLVILILFLLNKFLFQRIKNTAFLVFSPIQKFLWQENNIFSQALGSFFKFKKLGIENEELKKENFFLKAEISRLREIEKENEELREILELGFNQEFKLIMTQIISKKNESDSFLINCGEEEGVRKGMAVISKEKVLIGKVKEVFDDFSQVSLITERNFSFSVEVESEEEWILGACQGGGNYRLGIELLPKEESFKEGDLIITSILGGEFPKGLLVGEVKSIEKKAAEPFQSAEIEPYFKNLELKYLFLIEER